MLSSSPAHPVLVLQEHVILEQHLLQPGCAHEPPRGLLLPSGRHPWRSVTLSLSLCMIPSHCPVKMTSVSFLLEFKTHKQKVILQLRSCYNILKHRTNIVNILCRYCHLIHSVRLLSRNDSSTRSSELLMVEHPAVEVVCCSRSVRGEM